MYDQSTRNPNGSWLLLFALAAVPLSAAAGFENNTAAQNAGIWAAVSGNSTTMGMGVNGTIIPGAASTTYQVPGQKAVNLSGWTAAGNFGAAQSATGATVGSTVNMPLGGGRTVPLQVTSALSAAKFAKGLLSLAGGPLGIAIFAVSEIAPYLASAGAAIDPTNNPATPFDVASYAYGPGYQGSPACGYSFGTGALAMRCGLARQHGITEGDLDQCTGTLAGNDYSGQCRYIPNGNYLQGGSTRAASGTQQITVAELLPYLEPVIQTPAQVKKALELGASFEVDPPVVTGPASVTGPATTVSTPAQNGNPAATTTTATTNNITYAGDTYISTQNIVSTVNNGVTTTVTTTTEESPPPDDPCKAAPDTIGCAKFGTPVPEVLPSSNVPVTLDSTPFAATAGCPAALSIPLTISTWSHTVEFSYEPLCVNLDAYVKPIVLLLSVAAAAFIFVGGLKS